MKTLLDRIIEEEVSGSKDDEMEGIGFELEISNSAYPGISCITPGHPYVLHCFPPFKSELTKEQHDHLDIIARKIRQSFSTSRPCHQGDNRRALFDVARGISQRP